MYDHPAVRRNTVIMLGAATVFGLFALTGSIGRGAGIVLLVTFVVVMLSTARSTLQSRRLADPSTPLDWVLGLPSRLGMILAFIVGGSVMLPLGAERLVTSAVAIAANFQVPEAVIGLTVLAIGTSLPELTTVVLAAMERRSDVAIGAIIGSNTFNVLTIMGVTAALSAAPIEVSPRFLWLDIPVMLITSGVLAYFAWKVLPLRRRAGIAMLAAYATYLVTLLFVV
jgi:cation:H+ antiporter